MKLFLRNILLSFVVVIQPVQSILGETHPSCVEIADIDPPLHFVLRANRYVVDTAISITFSKPVYHSEEHNEGIFLSGTPLLGDETNTGKELRRQYPVSVKPVLTNHQRWRIHFKIADQYHNTLGTVFRYVIQSG